MSQITPELCANVVSRYTTEMFHPLHTQGVFGRTEGSLIIANITVDPGNQNDRTEPVSKFYGSNVVYEHSWGDNPIGPVQAIYKPSPTDLTIEKSFTRKALEKVYGAVLYRKDYAQVLADDKPEIAELDLIRFPGAVIRDVTPSRVEPRIVVAVGYAGLWWWHDEFLAEITASGIKAELAKAQNANR